MTHLNHHNLKTLNLLAMLQSMSCVLLYVKLCHLQSGGFFDNGKDACPIQMCLEEFGHPQPPTPLKTDNTTAEGIANDTVKQKRSKAMDMR
jgi:hypothetical protein